MYMRTVAPGSPAGPGLGSVGGRLRIPVPRLFYRRRGMGALACPDGYHSYTPDGVNFVCQADVFTVGENYSNTVIAAEAAANPDSVFGNYVNTFGSLPNDVQEQLENCKLSQSNSVVFNTPVAPGCVGSDADLIAKFMKTSSSSPANAGVVQMVKGQPVAIQVPMVLTAQGTAPPVSKGGSDLYASTPATAALSNTTRSGQSFQVGDSFRLVITGAPNTQVLGTVQQVGKAASNTNPGKTDANGQLVISGSMDASTVGSWSEQWTVGGAQAPVLSFSVAAAPGQPPAPAGANNNNTTGNGPGVNTSAGPLDFLTNTFSVFGFDVPMWGALLAGGFGVYAFSGGGKGR